LLRARIPRRSCCSPAGWVQSCRRNILPRSEFQGLPASTSSQDGQRSTVSSTSRQAGNFLARQKQAHTCKCATSFEHSVCTATRGKNFTRTPEASTRAVRARTVQLRTRLLRRSEPARSVSERMLLAGAKQGAARLVSSSVPANACGVSFKWPGYRYRRGTPALRSCCFNSV
jgi:hypothetical protein